MFCKRHACGPQVFVLCVEFCFAILGLPSESCWVPKGTQSQASINSFKFLFLLPFPHKCCWLGHRPFLQRWQRQPPFGAHRPLIVLSPRNLLLDVSHVGNRQCLSCFWSCPCPCVCVFVLFLLFLLHVVLLVLLLTCCFLRIAHSAVIGTPAAAANDSTQNPTHIPIRPAWRLIRTIWGVGGGWVNFRSNQYKSYQYQWSN